MPHTTTAKGSSQAHTARAMPRCFTLVGAALRRVTTNLFVGYRPERHYMRGPGPKWHARNSAPPR